MTFSMMTSLVTVVDSHADISHLPPHAQASGWLAHLFLTPSWICFWRLPCSVSAAHLPLSLSESYEEEAAERMRLTPPAHLSIQQLIELSMHCAPPPLPAVLCSMGADVLVALSVRSFDTFDTGGLIKPNMPLVQCLPTLQ